MSIIEKFRISICKLLMNTVRRVAPKSCPEGQAIVAAMSYGRAMLAVSTGMAKMASVLFIERRRREARAALRRKRERHEHDKRLN